MFPYSSTKLSNSVANFKYLSQLNDDTEEKADSMLLISKEYSTVSQWSSFTVPRGLILTKKKLKTTTKKRIQHRVK